MDFRTGTAAVVLLLALLCGGSEGLQNLTAEPGQNVTLTCDAPQNLTVLVVEWRRADLGQKKLFVVRQNRLMEGVHQQFRNRVFVPEEAEGSESVVVRNVTLQDSGTYTCQIKQTASRISAPLRGTSIRLLVTPPPGVGVRNGSRPGHDHLMVGGVAAGGAGVGFVVVGLVVCFIVKYKKNKDHNDPDNNRNQRPERTSVEEIHLNGDNPESRSSAA
ncbi:T-cell surface glycoprotein CD4 [Oryzias melastigma]|uniref:T-cell surface glycoprotein CD4 n=1 Tax=Oryzias melastigma TaxID=30732 RepID=UPI000CF809EA|nr:T-cell surface glycoprotein CD4 [Oryzias melastigma]